MTKSKKTKKNPTEAGEFVREEIANIRKDKKAKKPRVLSCTIGDWIARQTDAQNLGCVLAWSRRDKKQAIIEWQDGKVETVMLFESQFVNLGSRIQVNELNDFSGPLSKFYEIVTGLVAHYGADATIHFDAGYNNVSVLIKPYDV